MNSLGVGHLGLSILATHPDFGTGGQELSPEWRMAVVSDRAPEDRLETFSVAHTTVNLRRGVYNPLH